MALPRKVLVVATRHRLPRYKLTADVLARLESLTLEVLANQWGMLGFIRRSWRLSATRRDWVIIHSAHVTAFVWAVLGLWRSGARVALWYGGDPLADLRSTFWPNLRQGQLAAALLPICCLPLTLIAERSA